MFSNKFTFFILVRKMKSTGATRSQSRSSDITYLLFLEGGGRSHLPMLEIICKQLKKCKLISHL